MRDFDRTPEANSRHALCSGTVYPCGCGGGRLFSFWLVRPKTRAEFKLAVHTRSHHSIVFSITSNAVEKIAGIDILRKEHTVMQCNDPLVRARFRACPVFL